MLPSEYNPEAEQCGVEDSLAYVTKEQRERHVDPQRYPLQRDWQRMVELGDSTLPFNIRLN